jgi:hypothetical protein
MRHIAAALFATAAAACAGSSGPNIPQDSTISLDREPAVLPAAYVGTEQNESLQVLNQGRHPLTITSIRLAAPDGGTLATIDHGGVFGAPAFSDALPAQVPGLGAGFIGFSYRPSKPGASAAKLIIESDSPSRPHLEVDVTACGVGVDGGMDAGC